MRVLVIGGGVSGLAAAVALRGEGIDAVVFERRRDAASAGVGAAVHLWSNAMLALDHLGLSQRALAVSAPIGVQEFCTADGRVLHRWDLARWGEEIGQPTIGITRTALHGVLAGALDEEALRFGAEYVACEQDSDGVTARFADGSEERGDVLLGADGLESSVRRQLFPQAKLRYAESCWRTVVEFDSPAAPPQVFAILHGRGQRFLHYHVDSGHVLWLASGEAKPGVADPARDTKESLLERFGSFASPAPELIAATTADSVPRTDLYELYPPLASWSQGRVGLVGDAAHAITVNVGQGACQAIEDAPVLARHLREQEQPAIALERFAAERKERTLAIGNVSRRVGSINAWANPLAVRLREFLMRRTFTVAGKNFRQTLGYDAASGRSVLPESRQAR